MKTFLMEGLRVILTISSVVIMVYSVSQMQRLLKLKSKLEAISCKRMAYTMENIQRDKAGLPLKYGEDSFLALERDLKVLDSLMKNRKAPI